MCPTENREVVTSNLQILFIKIVMVRLIFVKDLHLRLEEKLGENLYCTDNYDVVKIKVKSVTDPCL